MMVEKQFLVRGLCGCPAEFIFLYVFASSEEEAKKIVNDGTCHSLTAKELTSDDEIIY
jgi:hypothetical protein